jgi:hypothetical protein
LSVNTVTGTKSNNVALFYAGFFTAWLIIKLKISIYSGNTGSRWAHERQHTFNVTTGAG